MIAHIARTIASRRVATLVALAILAAACGQYRSARSGRETPTLLDRSVGTGLTAHGKSGRSRTPGVPATSKLEPAGSVRGGKQGMEVPIPDTLATVTYPQWAALFLQHTGLPVCGNNLVAVVAWEAQENTRAAWNPLATTLPMPGATRFNSHGVRNYTSLEQGLDATARTLAKGWTVYGYGPIVASLQACAHPMLTARAINTSSWCAGCTSGRYVTGIVGAVAAAFRAAGGG